MRAGVVSRGVTPVDGVLVTGAPRSGTSMVAQLFVDAGLRTSDQLISASASNPHGFVEDVRVNRLNDIVLAGMRTAGDGAGDADRLPRRLWWLESFDGAPDPAALDADEAQALVPPGPFVVKDPRFCHTAPLWRPLLGDHVVVVVVRSAPRVATSVRRMAEREPAFFGDLAERPERIVDVVGRLWSSSYGAALGWADDDTFFVDGDDASDPTLLAGLSRRIGITLSDAAVDPTLRHSRPADDVRADRRVVDAVAVRVAADRDRLRSWRS